MAESRDRMGADRKRNEEQPSGMSDENVTGRANDEGVDEFEDTEDLDEEDEEEEEESER